MGVALAVAEMIVAEHVYRPLPRQILLLGRQTMNFRFDELIATLDRFGIDRDGLEPEFDDYTLEARKSPDEQRITDGLFFRALGVETIDAIDVDLSEGANIQADLSLGVPEELHGRYSFIFNGSVLDNVHDPAAALRNVSLLLAPQGRVIHLETAISYVRTAYVTFSPSWFYDYFVVNRFADCKLYVGVYPLSDGEGVAVLAYDPPVDKRSSADAVDTGDLAACVVTIAERGIRSTTDRTPIQSHYRSECDWQEFMKNQRAFEASSRPILMAPDGLGERIPAFDMYVSSGHWGRRQPSAPAAKEDV